MYQLPSGSDIFAIRDANGRVIAAAPPLFGEFAAEWPGATFEPVRFSVRLDTEPGDFDGLSISRETVTGLVSVSVGRSSAGAATLYALMRKFIHDTIWAVSILVLAALAVGILGIRSGLKPVRSISEMAAAIGPHAMSGRLPDKGLPSEISPLVTAVNRGHERRDLAGKAFVGEAPRHRVWPDRSRHLGDAADRFEAAANAEDSDGQGGEHEDRNRPDGVMNEFSHESV